MSTSISRRQFLASVAAGAAAAPFLAIPSKAASPMVRHASIGASGQALSDLMSFAEHPGVRSGRGRRRRSLPLRALQQRFPKVRVYQDWREMLKKERKNIDSVSISTPDHMHCLMAVEAMKLGKPVYVQKPLCNNLHETRLLTEFARRKGLSTQMGIQVSSMRSQRYRRSARPQRHRRQDSRGAHVLEQELGRRQAAAAGHRSGAGAVRLG